MPLDKEQTKHLVDFLLRISQGAKCPLCGKNEWSIADGVWELREYSGGNLRVGGPIFPIVLLVCSSCGNTMQISAVKAGVVQAQAQKETSHE